MLVDNALSMIKEQLQFFAKDEIVEKYNADLSQIENSFFYKKDGVIEYRHPFYIIDDSLILSTLYNQILVLGVKTTPLKLLVEKGNASNLLRPVNDEFDLRKPSELQMGQHIDIDEVLALSAMYATLEILGVREAGTIADEILSEYDKHLVMPEIKDTRSLNFRFSIDGNTWHDSYQSGDKFFAIYKNNTWGNSIPIGGSGGGSSGGSTTFKALTDTPNVYVAGKILKTTSSGIVFADEKEAGAKSFLSLNDTPTTFTASKLVAVNSSGSALEFVDMPSGGGSGGGGSEAFEDKGYFPSGGALLKQGSKKQIYSLTGNVEFSLGLGADYAESIEMLQEYTILVKLNGNKLTFAVNHNVLGNATGATKFVMFRIMKSNYGIFIYDISSV